MHKITYIKDMRADMEVQGFYLCKKIMNKFTRLGDPYMDLLLEDKTGTIRAKIWSRVEIYKNSIKEGNPVAIKGKIIEYNNDNEINISYINHIKNGLYDKYGYEENKIIKKIEENEKKLLKYLYDKMDVIDILYRTVIKKIIKDNIKKVESIPSINHPYDLKGGFLLEIVSILKINDKIVKQYKNLDNSIIVAGIIMKNIGLIDYFNEDYFFSVKEENEDMDLRLLSVNIISKYFNKSTLDNVKIDIQKIILSENDSNRTVGYINNLYSFNKNINQYDL